MFPARLLCDRELMACGGRAHEQSGEQVAVKRGDSRKRPHAAKASDLGLNNVYPLPSAEDGNAAGGEYGIDEEVMDAVIRIGAGIS